MRQLSWSEFATAEGSTYRVECPGHGSVDVTLEKVAELTPSGRAGGSFRLEFRGPPEPILPQATYQFRRAGEEFEIFIVPIGRDDKGTLYEAVFF